MTLPLQYTHQPCNGRPKSEGNCRGRKNKNKYVGKVQLQHESGPGTQPDIFIYLYIDMQSLEPLNDRLTKW